MGHPKETNAEILLITFAKPHTQLRGVGLQM